MGMSHKASPFASVQQATSTANLDGSGVGIDGRSRVEDNVVFVKQESRGEDKTVLDP
jgi:hypothetical protein